MRDQARGTPSPQRERQQRAHMTWLDLPRREFMRFSREPGIYAGTELAGGFSAVPTWKIPCVTPRVGINVAPMTSTKRRSRTLSTFRIGRTSGVFNSVI